MEKSLGENIRPLLLCVAILAAFWWSSDITFLLSLLIFIILLFTVRGREFIRSLGFRKQENWLRTIGIALACVVGLLFMHSTLSVLIPDVSLETTSSPQDSSTLDENIPEDEDIYGPIAGVGSYLFLLVSSVIIGGFVEEMLFRGILLTRLSKVLGDSNGMLIAIIVVTSLIFGYIHLFQGLLGAVSATLFSIVVGFIYVKTNFNLWIVILIHSLNNIIAISGAFLLAQLAT